MTIALGILAGDGIVIAADSEISTSIDMNGVGRKLVAATQQAYGNQSKKSIGVAGAGSLGYWESVRLKVVMTILQGMSREPFADSNVEQDLEALMAEFHMRHVVPFAKFKNPPGVEILAGAMIGPKGMLLATENAAVRQAPDFEAIGMGAVYAKSILHNYWKPMRVESAALLAAYAVSRVKFTVSYCGKETHMIVIRPGVSINIPYTWIADCDRFLSKLARFQTDMFGSIFGHTEETVTIEEVRQEAERLRQAIREISSSDLTD